MLRYDQSDWVPVQTDSTLTLFYTPHPFQFILRATTDGTPPVRSQIYFLVLIGQTIDIFYLVLY